MIYGETVTAVDQARARFTKKWRLRCPAVVESLQEVAGLATLQSYGTASSSAKRF
jgi:hypothetical protein